MNQELQDLLASVRGELEVGLKKQASVEELSDEQKTFIDAAIEEIEKQASFGPESFMRGVGDALRHNGGMHAGEAAAKGLGNSLGTGIGALGLGLGALAAVSAVKAVSGMADKAKYERALAQAIAHSETLSGQDPAKVKRLGDTIYNIAPTVAQDPNILQNVLDGAVHYETMDLQTLRTLADLEARMKDGKGDFRPKNLTM